MTRLARLRSTTLLLFVAPGALALACSSDGTLPPGDEFGAGMTGGSGAVAGTSGNGHAGTSSSATGGSGATSSGGQGVGTGGTGTFGTGGTSALGGGTAVGGSSAAGGGAGHAASGSGGTFGAAGTFGTGGTLGTGGTFATGGTPSGGSGPVGAGGRGSMGFGGRSSGGAGGARAGAAATGVGGAGSSVAFSQVAAIVQAQCGKSTCHGGRQTPSLTSSNLTTLYNTLTSTTVRQCGSDHLVTKNDTANSALLELPQGTCSNFIMPQGCTKTPCLASADMTTITNWINAGAPGP